MDKIEKAIERFKLAAQMSEQFYQAPLIIATSGGNRRNRTRRIYAVGYREKNC